MKDILNFFLDWKVKLAALIFACIIAFSWHTVTVHNAVSVAKVEVQLEMKKIQEAKIDQLKKDSDKAQSSLKDTFDTQLKERDAKYKKLDTKYSNLVNSVSNRPDRPSSGSGISVNPRDSESLLYVDGSRLYRMDAQLLAGFAVRTEGLKIALEGCYADYDAVKKVLDDFKKAHQTP